MQLFNFAIVLALVFFASATSVGLERWQRV
jgi:hypothetical protein